MKKENQNTTILILKSTRERLNDMRVRRETYDDIINRILNVYIDEGRSK